MPGILDEFVVEIGLDPGKFTAGRQRLQDELGKTQQSVEGFGREVERQGAKISEIFGLTKRGVTGLVGAFAGAEAAMFIDRVATMDAHTGRLAASIGQSTHELSVWQNMVRMVGGSAEDASQTLSGLRDSFNDMAMGNTMPSPGFASLMSRAGIDWRTMSPGQSMGQMMQWLSTVPENQRRFWLRQVPGMNESMMFLMLEGAAHPERIREMREQIEKIGVASRLSAAEAADLVKKSGALQTAWEQFARVLFPSLTAALTALTALFTGKFGGLIASVLAGMAVGGTAGTVVPGLGTGIGAIAGGIAGGATYLSTAGMPATSPWVGAGTRGDRNNNPGNIMGMVPGAIGLDEGGFAKFPTWEAGANAMGALLLKSYQGLTLAQIQKKWAPDATAGYLTSMEAATGLKAGDIPDLTRGDMMTKLIRGMMRGEGTHVGGTQKTSSVTIGTINVSSNKADPKAVADQIPASMERYGMLGSINEGLT